MADVNIKGEFGTSVAHYPMLTGVLFQDPFVAPFLGRLLTLDPDHRLRVDSGHENFSQTILGLNVTLDALGLPGSATITVSNLIVSNRSKYSLGFTCDTSGGVAGNHDYDIITRFRAFGGAYQPHQNDYLGFWGYEDSAFDPPAGVLLGNEIPSGMDEMEITINANNLSGAEELVFTNWALGLRT